MAKLNLAKLLKSLATKKDLEKLPTKVYFDSRLKNFATKKDLKNYPTKKYIDDRFLAVRTEVWQVQEGLEELKERVKSLPTKVEYQKDMDKVMKELATVREEQTISSDIRRQTNGLEDRMETVEEKLRIGLAA